jgi:high-affinity iron transporter
MDPSAPEAATESRPRSSRRTLSIVAVVVLVLFAGGVAFVFHSSSHSNADAGNDVVVSTLDCASKWKAPAAGSPTFTVRNTSADPFEVDLLGPDQITVFGAIETLGAHTEVPLRVTLPPGSYTWRCEDFNGAVTFSPPGTVSGTAAPTAHPYLPVTSDQITAVVLAYRAMVTAGLNTLATDTDALQAAVATGDVAKEQAAWLTAHLQYERLGAAYDTFADYADKIDGRADGLPAGIHDKDFTGFHRLELALWTNEPQATVVAITQQLDADVHGLVKAFPLQSTSPNDVSLRTHEILENALQFELTGDTDEGSHTNLATVRANVDGTRMAFSAIEPLLQQHNAALVQATTTGLNRLATLLDTYDVNGTWRPLDDLTQAQREQLDSTVSQLLETVSPIPDILELGPRGD